MKQDQSYFKQVFYLREDNFGLKIKKNVALKITCKIVAFVCQKLPFTFGMPCLLFMFEDKENFGLGLQLVLDPSNERKDDCGYKPLL